jgi:hypothetical protein
MAMIRITATTRSPVRKNRPRPPRKTSTAVRPGRVARRRVSQAQARFFGAVAGGARVRGLAPWQAREMLRGVKVKALPPRTGKLPPGVGGEAKLRKGPRRKRKSR